jgi:hypothetical protein
MSSHPQSSGDHQEIFLTFLRRLNPWALEYARIELKSIANGVTARNKEQLGCCVSGCCLTFAESD